MRLKIWSALAVVAFFVLMVSNSFGQTAPYENTGRSIAPTGVWFILLDDANPKAFSHEHYSYGGAVTPNIDWIMKHGQLFPNGYTPHSTCRPALSTLHVGTEPRKHRILNNNVGIALSADGAFGTQMGRLGYLPYLGGKWWEDTPPSAFGFTLTEMVGRQQVIPKAFVRDGQDGFLRLIGGDKRWFAVWAPGLPHSPFDAPTEYLDRIDPNAIEVPEWVSMANAAAYKADQREYLANLLRADDAIGEGLEILRTKGTLHSTLIVLCSDNGWDYGTVSKQSPYEAGVNTPIVFCWPDGFDGGLVKNGIVALADIPPTVVALCGGESHPRWEGIDQTEALLTSAEPRAYYSSEAYLLRPLHGPVTGPPEMTARWVRYANWKYIRYERAITVGIQPNLNWIYSYVPFPMKATGAEELYDLSIDPYERVNVAGVRPDIVKLMWSLTQKE